MSEVAEPERGNPLRKLFVGVLIGVPISVYGLLSPRHSGQSPIWNIVGLAFAIVFALLYLKKSGLAWWSLLIQLQILPAYWIAQYVGAAPSSPMSAVMLMFVLWVAFIVWIFNVREPYFAYISRSDA